MREEDGTVVWPPVPRAGEVGLDELMRMWREDNDGAPAGAGGGGGDGTP